MVLAKFVRISEKQYFFMALALSRKTNSALSNFLQGAVSCIPFGTASAGAEVKAAPETLGNKGYISSYHG